jgi:hypothetical protein
MPLKPLEVLKKGLKILQDQVRAKKEKLQAQLHAKKSISSLDENWLDNEANEKQLTRALDDLESTGVLQPSNRMDIEALLNPVDELPQVMEETTDEEICQAVLDAKKAQEAGLINGGDDDVDDDPSAIEPCPTHREVLQAASVINKYIDTLNDPIARSLEGVLASFRYQMWLEMSCSMKSTHLTDYFHCV